MLAKLLLGTSVAQKSRAFAFHKQRNRKAPYRHSFPVCRLFIVVEHGDDTIMNLSKI